MDPHFMEKKSNGEESVFSWKRNGLCSLIGDILCKFNYSLGENLRHFINTVNHRNGLWVISINSTTATIWNRLVFLTHTHRKDFFTGTKVFRMGWVIFWCLLILSVWIPLSVFSPFLREKGLRNYYCLLLLRPIIIIPLDSVTEIYIICIAHIWMLAQVIVFDVCNVIVKCFMMYHHKSPSLFFVVNHIFSYFALGESGAKLLLWYASCVCIIPSSNAPSRLIVCIHPAKWQNMFALYEPHQKYIHSCV